MRTENITDPVRCLALAVLARAIHDLSGSSEHTGDEDDSPQGLDPNLPPVDSESIREDIADEGYFVAVATSIDGPPGLGARKWLAEDVDLVRAWCFLAGISARRYYRAACGRLNDPGHPVNCIERSLDSPGR
jgi:hypothetical protein